MISSSAFELAAREVGVSAPTDLVVKIALDEAKRGVFENANDNRGERVDEYQVTANSTVGQMWCAKFAWWCFEQAASRLHQRNPFPRIFAAAALETWASREKLIVASPGPGDLFVKARRHVGIAAGPLTRAGTVPAVEGNTWTGKKRRDGVYATDTTRGEICVFIRLA